jgi:solute carrier family 25 phosphate transporter 23/24/25/41
LKVRLCLRRTGEFSNTVDAIKRIYKIEGSKAFWRGYLLNQIGIVPYAGFDLACYEVIISISPLFSNHFFYKIFRVLNVLM